MKKNLYIYCSGGLGQEIAEYCKRIQEKYNRWNKIYYIDDVRQEKVFDGFEVFTYEEFKKIADKENSEVVIATGEPDARRLLFDKVDSDGYNFATIVAVTSIVEPSAKLGKGVVVAEFCHISTNAVLNENVFVNLHACVGHN